MVASPSSQAKRRMSEDSRQAFVAAFRSGITDGISAAVGFPVAVLAATEDPWRHAKTLTARRHAAWLASAGTSAFRQHPHRPEDAAYTVLRMDVDGKRHPPLPPDVTLVDGALRLSLPVGATVREFGELLALALHDLRLDVLASDPEEVLRRHRLGLAANVTPRYSRGPGSSRRRFALVDDLHRFRGEDASDVAACAELALAGLSVRAGMAAIDRRGDGR